MPSSPLPAGVPASRNGPSSSTRDDPARSFGQMVSATDAFTTWFLACVKAIHGVDLAAPMTSSPSELVVDSERAAVLAR
jgi:hypothetical protein